MDEQHGTGEHELPGHPSQAEGEDPDRAGTHPDPELLDFPSQAEGEDFTDEYPAQRLSGA